MRKSGPHKLPEYSSEINLHLLLTLGGQHANTNGGNNNDIIMGV